MSGLSDIIKTKISNLSKSKAKRDALKRKALKKERKRSRRADEIYKRTHHSDLDEYNDMLREEIRDLTIPGYERKRRANEAVNGNYKDKYRKKETAREYFDDHDDIPF